MRNEYQKVYNFVILEAEQKSNLESELANETELENKTEIELAELYEHNWRE